MKYTSDMIIKRMRFFLLFIVFITNGNQNILFAQDFSKFKSQAVNGYYFKNIIPFSEPSQVGFGVVIPAYINNDSLLDFYSTKTKYPQNLNSGFTGYEVSTFEVLINQGNFLFKKETKQYVKDSIFIIRDDGINSISDLNGDGVNDLIFAGEPFHNNPQSIYYNIGIRNKIDVDSSKYYARRPNVLISNNGKLIDSIGFLDTLALKSYFGSLIFDWNNDGKDDLVLSERGDGKTFQFWENKGNKMSLTYPITETPDGIGVCEGPFNITAFDLNKDGFKDFIFCGPLGDIYVCFNTKGNFNDKNVIKIFDYKNLPVEINHLAGSHIEIKDLDNDNNPEIITLFSVGSGTHDAIDRNNVKSIFKILTYTGTIFNDVTEKYFPTNLNVNSFYSNRQFKLIDLDQDGLIDLYPITGDNGCTTKSPKGCGYFGYLGNDSTVYFKNMNGSFKIKSLGLFFTDSTSQNIYNEFKQRKINIGGYNLALGNQIVPYFVKGIQKPVFVAGIQKQSVEMYEGEIYNDSLKSIRSRIIQNSFLNYNFRSGFMLIPCENKKPTFNMTKYSFCAGDSLKLSIVNVNKGDSLKWYFGTKTDLTNVSNKTFTDSSKLFVTRIDSIGCMSTSDTIQIIKTPRPSVPSLSRDADNNLVSNATGNTWHKDGVKISDTTQKFKPTSNGIYTATTTQNGCTSALSQGYYYLTNAIANLSNGEYFKVSPNPTLGELNIDYKFLSNKHVYISIIDINARNLIFNKKIYSGSKINLGSASKGNYIIQVKDKTGRLLLTQKIIKD